MNCTRYGKYSGYSRDLIKTDGIKLEGIYGEERYFTSKKNVKNTGWNTTSIQSRFRIVDDLWSFLTDKSDVEEKAIVVRKKQQELLNSLVNIGSEDLKQ